MPVPINDQWQSTYEGTATARRVTLVDGGGNLVAVDSLGASLDPVLPSMGTNVVVAAASTGTAGLANSDGLLTTVKFLGLK